MLKNTRKRMKTKIAKKMAKNSLKKMREKNKKKVSSILSVL